VRSLFVDAFTDAAVAAAAQRLGSPVRRGKPSGGSPSHAVNGIAALVGLTGGMQGRLMLDLDPPAAAALGGSVRDRRRSVAVLAEGITAHALAVLRSRGVRVDATPPMVFTGRNLEVTTSRMETVSVPITMPGGTLVVSIAARTAEGRTGESME
jgi:chemotaxis protein CheX